jgi:1-acyl-sn-glycerol-3-phosphate acyltransferase/acyl carrier protein
MIVLPDGKNVFPEAIEAIYGDSPFVGEAAVLEHEGLLVLLVVPEDEAIRAHGAARPEALLREEIERLSRSLAPYQRASGFAITREPLPRTPLSKLKRHRLPALYSRATAGAAPAPASNLSENDRALLTDPAARPVWDWLQDRYPGRRLSLDTSPQLDLGLDSLAWVGLSLEMEQRFGTHLTEQAISRVVTLRDLLDEVASAKVTGAASALEPTPDQRRWLKPTGVLLSALGLVVYAFNWAVFHGLFRLRVESADRVPTRTPIVLVPNHLSHLDAFVLAAALPWRRLRHTYWAGWTGALFTGPVARLFSRIAQVLPVDPDRSPGAALALAEEVLKRGEALVWFAEGRRSPDGTLQPFQPGIGHVLTASRAAALPVLIRGTSEALPTGRRTPRLAPLSVRFGAAISFLQIHLQGQKTQKILERHDAQEAPVQHDQQTAGIMPTHTRQRLHWVGLRSDRVVSAAGAHHLAYPAVRPVVPGHALEVARGDAADQALVLDHWKEVVMEPVDVILDQLQEREAGRHSDRVRGHEARHRLTFEGAPGNQLYVGALGRAPEEQADQEPPHAANEIPVQDVQHAQGHQEERETLADPHGAPGGPAQITFPIPKRRPERPPAVEGKGRHQIESRQQ